MEAGIRAGGLAPGAGLPTVRALAEELAVSPTTVAAAYRLLRERGLAAGAGRRGTAVNPRPAVLAPAAEAVVSRAAPSVPPDARNLASGAPDPKLLPNLRSALRAVKASPRLYDEPLVLPELERLAASRLRADGVPADAVTVVGGALDGIERVLTADLRPGDRVAVEDPGYPNLLDLLAALGHRVVPVAIDEAGMRPDALEPALRMGVAAVVLTPRAQNPTGAAVTPVRARELRRLLRTRPEVVVVEDDHAAGIAGRDHVPVVRQSRRWAVVRSTSKVLGPDLRMAFLAADQETIARVIGRRRLGAGWVSRILQELVLHLLAADSTSRLIATAAERYAERRSTLLDALARRGVAAQGASGLNVWVPVHDETATAQALAEAGWAVDLGHRYRIASPPAIRITTSTLLAHESQWLAADLASWLDRPRARYAG